MPVLKSIQSWSKWCPFHQNLSISWQSVSEVKTNCSRHAHVDRRWFTVGMIPFSSKLVNQLAKCSRSRHTMLSPCPCWKASNPDRNDARFIKIFQSVGKVSRKWKLTALVMPMSIGVDSRSEWYHFHQNRSFSCQMVLKVLTNHLQYAHVEWRRLAIAKTCPSLKWVDKKKLLWS